MSKKELIKKVLAKWIMRLPDESRVEIKTQKGEEVKIGQELAVIEEKETFYLSVTGIIKGWSREKLEEWKARVVGQQFDEGEVLVENKGLSPTKIFMDRKAKISEIDEFGRVKCESTLGRVREVKAPANGKVNKIETGKMTLEFEAWEVCGDGWGKGKVWGDLKTVVLDKASEMRADLASKTVMVSNIDQVKLSKLEVIGVSAVLIISDEKLKMEDFVFEIPVVVLSEAVAEQLLTKVKEMENPRTMVNSNTGRVLVVVK